MGLVGPTRAALRLARFTVVLLGAFGVLGALAILAPARASATFPGRPGRIAWAYAANDPNFHFSPDYGIRTVSPSGGANRTLASCFTGDPNGNPISCPQYSDVSYSANGARLVWTLLTTAGIDELVVAKAGGGHRTVIAHAGESDFQPSFSPQGNRLVYVRFRRSVGRHEIVTSDLSGGHVRLVTTVTGRNPKFSPNGRRILFIHGYSAWVVGANGHGAKKLIPSAVSADWSPNGNSIVVVTPYRLLRTVHADGTGRVRLHVSFPGGGVDFSPSVAVFSPDGKSIAFDSTDQTSSPTIYTVPIAGGRACEVDTYPTDDEGTPGSGAAGLTWQPLH